ncbi:MAG TPA: hypothetical protein PLE74_01770 [Candidatus Cloacimonadota bacterium]|nr:hypothetical protein [Candidatus Cloacimonadota bacterium]HPT70993.1 hypothetical protein [Candidatus Cloacimonadota bacterium]
MRCKHCNEKVKDHDFWCVFCGHPTGIVKTYLSAKNAIREEWDAFTSAKNKSYLFAILVALILLILGGGAYWFSINNSLLQVSPFVKYLLNNLVFLVVLPLLLTPFNIAVQKPNANWSFGDYFRSLKAYPRYFVFIFLNIVYFFILKYICQGDPILHLVRLVMVMYWIAIILPAPLIMEDLKLNPYKAIVKAYHVGRETRWQLFFLWFMLMVINLVAIIPLGLGLLVTLPLTYRVIYRYYMKLVEFELIPEAATPKELKVKQA